MKRGTFVETTYQKGPCIGLEFRKELESRKETAFEEIMGEDLLIN